ncbi:hypothetical protein AKJ41_00870 [candidate division MSBL1 archaeon SCGC-AAA259O05]|uniref:Uncharacterized protein n=1 Tax=candidate division MSBL1 archaeon SCGC-AAA259O05 TaxID=1698271 RepID=A0A133V5C0_9EURY|nr:hypothetical protein AKJ41_00870 [candidate division MSBL1 archaeon SCGC-AAA259O05]
MEEKISRWFSTLFAYFNPNISRSGPVEFTKIYFLPSTEFELLVSDWYYFTRSYKRGLKMSVGIPLHVLKIHFRHDSVESTQQVFSDCRVSPLVYRYRGGSVRAIN